MLVSLRALNSRVCGTEATQTDGGIAGEPNEHVLLSGPQSTWCRRRLTADSSKELSSLVWAIVHGYPIIVLLSDEDREVELNELNNEVKPTLIVVHLFGMLSV